MKSPRPVILTTMLWSLSMALCATGQIEHPTMLYQGRIPGSEIPGSAVTGNDVTVTGRPVGYAMMRLPDGTFAFYDRYRPDAGPLALPDHSGTSHVLLPHLPSPIASNLPIIKSGILNNQQVVLTADNMIKSVFVRREDLAPSSVAKIGLPRYLNVWLWEASLMHVRDPKMIWRGYNGSQMEYQQLKSGRLLVPFGSFQPHTRAIPPIGRHKTVIQFSDDAGTTWKESQSQLTSPCYFGFNGNNEGACEPAIEQLKDGRLWMLMRTQAGFLYESFSSDDGTTWEPASASRFNTSTGPPNIMRHRNGWLVVSWNNCEMPPRKNQQGVYGGRDALHIAVSDDEGNTWQGFREIYLDHRRNDNPARSGDRGTAYPLGAYTLDGTIVMLAGQGEGGRNPILINPQWILETTAHTDFSDGLKQWSVYKHIGPARRWWRARTLGCKLVSNPTDAATQSLLLRKPDEHAADGATWNLPNGWVGSLTVRLMMQEGSQGGIVGLNDRMFDPSNSYGEEFAVFKTEFGIDRGFGTILKPDQWHDVTLKWNLERSACQILVDGSSFETLAIRNKTLNGISYVRFRSASEHVDDVGFLVDSVTVSIHDPIAPQLRSDDQRSHEQRYIENVVPTWSHAKN